MTEVPYIGHLLTSNDGKVDPNTKYAKIEKKLITVVFRMKFPQCPYK